MELVRYLVELRRIAGNWDGLPDPAAAARRRAEELASAGVAVRVVRSVYAPEDDTWFLVVEAATAAHAERLVGPETGALATISAAIVDPGPA